MSEVRTITADEVVAALKEVVTEAGPERGNGGVCVLTVSSGRPGCIIGQALHRIGVPLPDDTPGTVLPRDNACAIGELIGTRGWFSGRGVEFDNAAVTIMSEVQAVADGRKPPTDGGGWSSDGTVAWSRALRSGLERAGVAA